MYARRWERISAFLKNIDYTMRNRFKYRFALKPAKSKKETLEMINRGIDAFFAERKRLEQKDIIIDVSKLQDIRATALRTQNSLLVETDPETDPETETVTDPETETVTETVTEPEDERLLISPLSAAESSVTESSATESLVTESSVNATGESCSEETAEISNILDKTEKAFLRALLTNKSYTALLQKKGIILSVIVDSINEKLYEQLGDTALVWEDEHPLPVEDYLQELKESIK